MEALEELADEFNIRNPRTVVNAARRRQFQDVTEELALAKLDHPKIIHLHSVYAHHGQRSLVLTFADGRPLNELNRSNSAGVGQERATNMFAQDPDPFPSPHPDPDH